MLSVAQALERILAAVAPLPPASCALGDAAGRALHGTLHALTANPPEDVSAMDGYAVRALDVQNAPVTLKVVGEAPAGRAFEGTLGPGEAVRILTGGPVPRGADSVVLQEDCEALAGSAVRVLEAAKPGRHVRLRGSDFAQGGVLLEAGQRLSAPALSLAAAGGHARLEVAPRPKVALLATGDELVPPGTLPGPHRVIASNTVGLAALIAAAGGETIDLGIAPDDPRAIAAAASSCPQMDMLITTGGASVGARDFVQSALEAEGLAVDFWKIAMKPGKPLIFGRFKGKPYFGLPGNPVSALVTGVLFVRAALLKMQSRDPTLPLIEAILAADLPANGPRQDHLRARLDGARAHVFHTQDSAMLHTLARADALIVRPPHAPPACAGMRVPAIPLLGIW